MMYLRVLIGCGIAGLLISGSSGHVQPTPYVFPDLHHFPPMPTPMSSVSNEGVYLGRSLFYDPILSADRSISCASCHKQEAAFSDPQQRFSIGMTGQHLSRNTMPLFNLAWYPAFFWDGRTGSLEEQVLHPVRAHDEMGLEWSQAVQRISKDRRYRELFRAAFGHQRIDSTLIAAAIAQFELTLISNNSKYDQVLRGMAHFTPDEYEGFVLVNDQSKGDCLHCHTTDADALGTTRGFSNNGLDLVLEDHAYPDPGRGAVTGDSKDAGHFRIPSLRNIAVTAPYMHDGRFRTLEEVIDFYSEGVHPSSTIDPKMAFAAEGGVRLTASEKTQIVAFLRTLTDSTFLSNPAFGPPL